MNAAVVTLLMQPGLDLPDLVIERPGWQAQGACADADTSLFFIERGGDTGPAKALCAVCPVLGTCREYALADPGLRGFWAGMSERDRQRSRALADAA